MFFHGFLTEPRGFWGELVIKGLIDTDLFIKFGNFWVDMVLPGGFVGGGMTFFYDKYTFLGVNHGRGGVPFAIVMEVLVSDIIVVVVMNVFMGGGFGGLVHRLWV